MTAASRAWRFAACALACCVLACSALSFAQAPDAALDARLKTLESQLRCLVCQNQTLADSDATLAGDLRREVRALAVAGKSDGEIKDYLVARYGDFVLYDPPVKSVTWLLWFGPLALLVVGGSIWLVVVRRRGKVPTDDADQATGPDAPQDDVIAQAKAMLYEEP
jgi:cytochrome c-type biogenesis protein CcmH